MPFDEEPPEPARPPGAMGPMDAELARNMVANGVQISEFDWMTPEPGEYPDRLDQSGRALALNELARQPSRDRARINTFLAALRQSRNVRLACRCSGIQRTTAYEMRQQHPWFAALWTEAIEEWADLVDMRGQQLALEGYAVPVYCQGVVVGYERKISERILLRLLEKAAPERWGRPEQQVRHSGRIEGNGAEAGSQHDKAEVETRVKRMAPLLMARHVAALKGQQQGAKAPAPAQQPSTAA